MKYMTSIIIAALPKKFMRLSLLGSFSPKIDRYIHKHRFLAHFMVFSNLWDILYDENTLKISMSMYLGQKAPKKLHLIKANFFWRANRLIEAIYLNFSPYHVLFHF